MVYYKATESVAAAQDALATLQRLGHSADADNIIAEAEKVTSAYSALDADRDHSDEWKAQRAAQTYSNTVSTLAQQLTAAAAAAAAKHKTDTESVFGARGLPGDPGVNIVTLRDAQDRVAALEYDSIKLQRLLDRAVRNGDHTLARAIGEAAIESGDADTVQAFRQAFPATAEATARIWNAATRKPGREDIVRGMRLGVVLKPPAALTNTRTGAAR